MFPLRMSAILCSSVVPSCGVVFSCPQQIGRGTTGKRRVDMNHPESFAERLTIYKSRAFSLFFAVTCAVLDLLSRRMVQPQP